MLIGMGKRERVGGGQRSRTHWLVSRWLARWPRPLQASGPHTGNGPRSGCWGQWWRGSHGWWGCPGCHLSRSAPSRSGARWWSSRGAPPRSPGSRFLRASGQWKKAGQWPEEPHLEKNRDAEMNWHPPRNRQHDVLKSTAPRQPFRAEPSREGGSFSEETADLRSCPQPGLVPRR